jgi:O-antigen/teichoic acid export membrane protein
VTGYLKRLLTTGAAYQASSILSSALALFTIPLYTRYLTPADYGYAETLLVFIIFTSILLRLGLGEAFVRFWFEDDDEERRLRLARTTTGFVVVATTLAAGLGVALAGDLSELLLAHRDAVLMSFGLLGLWAFTNLEVAYALLRVEERRRAYLTASVSNVLLTVALTVTLVVGLDQGARGYVLGNYGASTVVLLGLWIVERERLGVPARPRELMWTLVRFGGPTVPAEAAVYALNAVDRAYLLRAQSAGAAGLYALAAKLSMIVIIAVRGFQAAWPPLAYSVRDDDEARRLYAFVTTAYVLATGTVVAALALLGRWLVRLLAPPEFFPAHEALPWVALGWALYGLFLVFVTIAGRAKVTTRNFPAAAIGLAVNVGALVALVGPLGIAGAGIALCVAYAAMLTAIHLGTRRLFAVPFDWRRLGLLTVVLAAVAVGGELALPDSGVDGFVLRALALLAIPALLVLSRFFRPEEVARVRALLARRRTEPATEP